MVVPDDQLSLAIGKEGQNARLAARLTGYKIDIKSKTAAAELEEEEAQAAEKTAEETEAQNETVSETAEKPENDDELVTLDD